VITVWCLSILKIFRKLEDPEKTTDLLAIVELCDFVQN